MSVTVPDFFERKDAAGRVVADLLRVPAETQSSTPDAAEAALTKDFLVSERSYVAVKDEVYAETLRTNIKFVFGNVLTEDPARDQLKLVDDLGGSFPDLYVRMTRAQVPEFIAMLGAIDGKAGYEAFRAKGAVGREDPAIGERSDWFYRPALRRNPVEAGRYDQLRDELYYR